MYDNSATGAFVDAVMMSLQDRVPLLTARYNPIWSALRRAREEGNETIDALWERTFQIAFSSGFRMTAEERTGLYQALTNFFETMRVIAKGGK